jgi:RNA polymerase sigma factor (sigma-70 family)
MSALVAPELLKVIAAVANTAARGNESITTPSPSVTPDTAFSSPSAESYPVPVVDWPRLVALVRDGDTEGLEQLYRLFARGIRFYLCRQLGAQELDDKVHDTFLVIVQAVQKGDLREPERLMGFVRTIVRRQTTYYINANMQKRREEVNLETSGRLSDVSRSPEQSAISHETRGLILRVLGRMGDRDRQILTRFYLYEQPQEQICDEMDLSETQFRLLKSRAKSRFGQLGKKKMAQQALGALFVRTSLTA